MRALLMPVLSLTSGYLWLLTAISAFQEEVYVMDERRKAAHDAEILPPSFEENNGSKISQRDILAF